MTACKLLTNQLIVASDAFAKLIPAKQTEILAIASGKPIIFVNSFKALTNKNYLRDRLLAGEDVSMELEFNEIVLTDEERAALTAIKPILERIGTFGPDYPWITDLSEIQQSNIENIRFGEASVTRNGYSMSLRQLKGIWAKASAYWNDGARPANHSGTYDGYSRSVVYHPQRVEIGCQTLGRYELEAAAKHYNWEPSVPKVTVK